MHYNYKLHYSTTTTIQHVLESTLHSGPAPAHMLNGQGSGHLLVIEYYVLQHLLAIILCLKSLEPPEEGKSFEFPRKHAILADCTTID